jgi:hypothetical protein
MQPIQPINVMALSDGCLALFDNQFEMAMEGEVVFEYLRDSLLVGYGGIEILVPAAYFDHMFTASFEAEAGPMVNVHLYWREGGVYEAVFVGTISIEAETFIKAKGVAEYLSTATPP